jgi:nucleoside diphosphate-linked moiety X motif protein 19
MLEEHYQERVFLAPPQVYELSRIHNLPNFKSVQEFALKRQTMGVERWLPVISTYNNGALSVLPGLTSLYVDCYLLQYYAKHTVKPVYNELVA